MSGWLEDYLFRNFKEKMKHKATEVREKRTRNTLKGKSKVDYPLLSKLLQRIDRMSEKISKTSEDIRRMPPSSRSPPTIKRPLLRDSHRLLQHLLKCVEV